MSTPTTNFNWLKPTVGGDVDIWGGIAGLNFNLDSQDTLIRALANTNLSNTAPTYLQNGTMWIDNTTNPWIWSVYSVSTTTWIEIGLIDIVANTFTPANGTSGFSLGDYKISSQPSNHGNWLICDGSAISRTTYSGLFTLFSGLTPTLPFGVGDGSTTFNLPDLRGAVAGSIGLSGLVASGSNTPWSAPTTRAVGSYEGEEDHTLSSAELPNPLTSGAGIASVGGGATSVIMNTSAIGSGVISNNGGGGAHNTMQPTVFIGNYFIYTGV